MKHTWKKTAAFVLATALVAGVAPANVGTGGLFGGIVAHAEWTGKSADNTTLGTTGIEAPTIVQDADGWTGNYVYYGKYDGTNPTRYRVLDPSSAAFGVTGGSLLLDCDSILYNAQFDSSSNVWSSSAVRTGLNGDDFLNKANNLTAVEKGAIAASTKAQKSSTDGNGWDGTLNWASLDNDTIFLLDAKEATNTSYGYANTDNSDNARKKSGSSNTGWWLRSPSMTTFIAGFVYGGDGHINRNDVSRDIVRVSPAFNVNLSSVIFSSVISGESTATSGKEYKLTLKDTAFGIGVTTGSSVTADGTTITVPYTVTDTDANLNPDTVSVLIQSAADNSILYYAPLTGTYAASGTGTFTLPAALDIDDWGTGYTVSILAEDVNGQYETDYASVPVTLNAPLTTATLTDGKWTQKAQSGSKYYTRYVFVKPKSDIEGKSKATFTATYNDTPYTYETSTYYTAVISNGTLYTPASEDSVLFVVTVSSDSDISADLTCKLDFE